jgi:hypothetical protein
MGDAPEVGDQPGRSCLGLTRIGSTGPLPKDNGCLRFLREAFCCILTKDLYDDFYRSANGGGEDRGNVG